MMFSVSKKRQAILNCLEGRELSGAQLMKITGFWSGTLYPLLYGQENRGLVVSRWAKGPYPRRRLYSKASGQTA